MMFGIKLNDVHSSPKERQLQKTCVSFGEECSVGRASPNGQKLKWISNSHAEPNSAPSNHHKVLRRFHTVFFGTLGLFFMEKSTECICVIYLFLWIIFPMIVVVSLKAMETTFICFRPQTWIIGQNLVYKPGVDELPGPPSRTLKVVQKEVLEWPKRGFSEYSMFNHLKLEKCTSQQTILCWGALDSRAQTRTQGLTIPKFPEKGESNLLRPLEIGFCRFLSL